MTTDETLRRRWPEQLVKQIARGNYIMVVGAGASLNSTNAKGIRPPSWASLVDSLAKKFSSGESRKEINRLVKQGDYLEAAQLLRIRAKASSKESDFLNAIAQATDGGSTEDQVFKPSEFHQQLLRLNPSIIVTTNYDRILERATVNGYNMHPYTSATLAADVRSGNPVLVKVHGSVDNAADIVLTRTDYSRLRRVGADVLAVLQALFLTKTALFVGYSLNDPDIQLLLENVLGARNEVTAHYLFGSSSIKIPQKDVFSYCYGTSIISYKSGDIAEMHRMLELLGDLVEVFDPELA